LEPHATPAFPRKGRVKQFNRHPISSERLPVKDMQNFVLVVRKFSKNENDNSTGSGNLPPVLVKSRTQRESGYAFRSLDGK
jgi:hypothetical protein